MEEFVDFAPKSWCISPATACSEPTGGRPPMGFSVTPLSGADFVVIGDASGDINPFNGEGIAYDGRPVVSPPRSWLRLSPAMPALAHC